MPLFTSLRLTVLRFTSVAVCLAALAALSWAPLLHGAEPGKKSFDIPAGAALPALQKFTAQAGVQLLYAADEVERVKVNGAKGEFTPRDALSRMLAGTGLTITHDASTGALTVSATPSAPAQKPATPIPIERPSPRSRNTDGSAAADDEPVRLSEFAVHSAKDYGYRATNSMTASRVGTEIMSTPMDIAVITGEFLQDIGVRQFTDVMRYTSNVSVSAGEPDMTNSQASPVIRGFAAPFILRNGFRRNLTIIPANIDRVEVVKGPASTFFSQQAPGGVINYITLQPSFTPSASLQARVGSYDFKDFQANVTGPLGNSDHLAFRVFAMIEDSKDWRDWEYNKTRVATPSLLWRVNDRIEILFEGEYAWKKVNKGGGSPWGNPAFFAAWENASLADRTRWYSNISQWAFDTYARTGVYKSVITQFVPETLPKGFRSNLNGPDAFRLDQSYSGTIEATWRATDALSLRYSTNFYRVRFDRQNNFQDVPSGDRTFNLLGSITARASSAVDHVQQADAVYNFALGGMKHKVVVGVETWWDKQDNGRGLYDFNRTPQPSNPGRAPSPYFADLGRLSNYFRAYNPFTDQPWRINEVYTGGEDPFRSYITNERKSGYASYHARVFGDRLNLSAGVRREENDQVNWDTNNRTRVLTPTRGTTPQFGASFALSPELNVYAGYSTSYEPNSGLSVQGEARRADEGVPLGQRDGSGLDVGVKTALFGGKLTGTLSVYEVKQKGVPTEDGSAGENDPRNAGRPGSSYVVRFFNQSGSYLVRGVDADFLYTPTRNYQLLVSGAWMPTAEIVKVDDFRPPTARLADQSAVILPSLNASGQRMERTPDFMFHLWNKYTLVTGALKGLSLGAGGHWVSKLRPRGGNGNGAVVVKDFYADSYVTIDALLSYSTRVGGQRVDFSLQVKNVFDKFYVDSFTTAGDPRKFYLTTRLPF